MKCCLLDIALLSHSWTHGGCGYLHQTCIISSQPKFRQRWEVFSTLANATLADDSFQGKNSHSFLKVWLPVGFPCSDEWPHIHALIGSTKQTNWRQEVGRGYVWRNMGGSWRKGKLRKCDYILLNTCMIFLRIKKNCLLIISYVQPQEPHWPSLICGRIVSYFCCEFQGRLQNDQLPSIDKVWAFLGLCQFSEFGNVVTKCSWHPINKGWMESVLHLLVRLSDCGCGIFKRSERSNLGNIWTEKDKQRKQISNR